jgi:hypothetical protein
MEKLPVLVVEEDKNVRIIKVNPERAGAAQAELAAIRGRKARS